MEPKPLFPSKISTMAQSDQTKKGVPQPLFSKSETKKEPSVPKGPQPLFPPSPKPASKSFDNKAVFTNEEYLAFYKQEQQKENEVKLKLDAQRQINPGQVMFADKAIGNDVVDPFYKDHPLCKKLSNKDIGRVRHLVNTAKVDDTKYVLEYADDLRTQFGKLVDNIIQEQTSGQTAQINDLLHHLIVTLADSKKLVDLIINPPEPKGIMGWLKLQPTNLLPISEIVADLKNYTDIVDGRVSQLNARIKSLIVHIDSFDAMFKNNQENFTWLNLHVIAGRIIVEKHLAETIPKLERELDPTDIFNSQNVAYFKDSVDRFSRKIDELEKIAHSVVLNAPAIRLLQMGAKDKADRIQRISHTMVPTWKQYCFVLINALSGLNKLEDTRTNPSFLQKRYVLNDINTAVAAVQDALL